MHPSITPLQTHLHVKPHARRYRLDLGCDPPLLVQRFSAYIFRVAQGLQPRALLRSDHRLGLLPRDLGLSPLSSFSRGDGGCGGLGLGDPLPPGLLLGHHSAPEKGVVAQACQGEIETE